MNASYVRILTRNIISCNDIGKHKDVSAKGRYIVKDLKQFTRRSTVINHSITSIKCLLHHLFESTRSVIRERVIDLESKIKLMTYLIDGVKFAYLHLIQSYQPLMRILWFQVACQWSSWRVE